MQISIELLPNFLGPADPLIRRDVSPVMDTKLNQDIARLLSAAHNAIPVLRRNAEQLETIGQDSTAERDAVRQLNMAVQLLEYRIVQSQNDSGTLEA